MDAGDITWPGSDWLCDVKDQARWRVQEWASEVAHEAVDETARTGTRVKPLLLMKVPGVTDPGRWLAVVRLEDLEL